jgi:hypothetical protein
VPRGPRTNAQVSRSALGGIALVFGCLGRGQSGSRRLTTVILAQVPFECLDNGVQV